MTYFQQHPERPEFRYDLTGMEDILLVFAEETGHISGILKGTPNETETRNMLDFTLQKTRFLDHFKDLLNERETKVVQKCLKPARMAAKAV